ncbi:MAG: precorrin-3B C(17)-methyltransferase [Magnetospirillum sp.]|nr:precorrin-3B C(17)-methyltransferase [Magnetospirillum sp.]
MTAVVVLTPAALATGRRVAAAVPGARLHGLAGRVEGKGVMPFDDVAAHFRALFAAGFPIIGVCASGIVIRALAPVLAAKGAEPPVLAVAPDGSVVVPLLGGHRGANALALRLADALSCPAAITTAGELALGLALDVPPPGWRLRNPEAVKPVTAALLSAHSVRLEVEAGDAAWLSALPTADNAEVAIRITDRAVAGDGDELVLHPPVLALGVGCERGTPAEVLETLVRDTLAAEALAPEAVACVCSLDLKADEDAVQALAASLGVPARFFSAADLEAEAARLAHPSDVVFRETGCHGVAEGAALAAAGQDGRLIVPKVKGERVTVAVARAAASIDPATVGRARGRLFVVGIGPGMAEWRTPEASAAVAVATDLVGYGLYLDLLGTAADGKARHESGLGAETERARIALDLAAEGRTVALVCSGDPGIYALATLVFELMEREVRPEWNRLDLTVVPGVSALQAAAARAGAPINHDFCTISLSDLLTPWPTIEARLKAAAAADFVVCLYNPVSQRRRDQLARARDLLLAGRPAETPVVLARQLGRPGETVSVVTLGELTPEHADMLTLVMVGNSETRRFTAGTHERVYTPRGYAKKL